MFGAVMRNPKLCKLLLEYILKIKIRRIEYPELQKVIDERYESKGIRLDVYVEDDKNTVYNIEIQTISSKNLPKRMRYYQGLIDLHIISKGKDYIALKKSFVIFICTYDPFGKGRYIYTFENHCNEDDSVSFDDDTVKIVVNAQGTIGDISDELKDVLNYIAGGTPTTPYAKDLDAAVDRVRQDKEWEEKFMKLDLRYREHERLGGYAKTVSSVRKNKDEFDENTVIKFLGLDREKYGRIIYYINNNPNWDNYDIAEKLLTEEE